MQLKPELFRSLPPKPQVHSRKHHALYNATRRLPVTTLVRGSSLIKPSHQDDSLPVYQIVLCFDRNRACTIHRSWRDLERLRQGMGTWKGATKYTGRDDINGIHQFLSEALTHKSSHCALEFFLRRRMDDCGGCC